MVYCSSTNTMSSQNESVEVNSLSLCWNAHGTSSQDFLLDGHKLLLSDDLDETLSSDSESQKKSSLDILDNLLSNTSSSLHPSLNNTNLAELKPLPPFTGYTGHLSINGISGHHYHAIAQRLPEENNNNYAHISFNQCSSNENNIVSSSTCLPDSDASETCLPDVKLFSESSIESKIYSTITSADSCLLSSSIADNHTNTQDLAETKIFVDAKELVEYDMSSIEDIAAIIGSAIADTTVPNRSSDNGDTRDSWMDLDAWIEETVVPQDNKLIVSQNDNLSEFLLPNSPLQSSSTLQNLLSHGYMPLLQNRLQNGPPIKNEAQSTSYCSNDIITTSSTTSPPPVSVCSTTDLGGNRQNFLSSSNNRNYSHTITSSSTTTKLKRPRNPKKNQGSTSNNVASTTSIQTNASLTTAHGFQTTNDLSGLLGKEKPVHRCTICNRGFLNKSNIKVHLRTHTGEKPFRCETCAKAFRQKAHLIKHQQIHKRIGRD